MHPWRLAAISLAGVLVLLAVTWDAYDVDEFVNLQQGLAVRDGQALYDDAPSNHPPGYALLLAAASWVPGPALLGPRLLSAMMLWGAGLMVADLYRRADRPTHAKLFVGLWVGNVLLMLHATRAVNEVPVLFLVTSAAYVALRRDLGEKRLYWVGVLLACSFLVRYTTVWFAPVFLFAGPRRVARIIVGGLGMLAFFAAWVWLFDPFSWQGWWEQTVTYHADRAHHPFWFRFAMIAVGAGGPILLFTSAFMRGFWRDLGPKRNMLLAAWGTSWLFLLLPVTWMHYLMPLSPIIVVVVTEALLWRPSQDITHLKRRKTALAGIYIATAVVTASVLMVYDFMPDMDEVEPVAMHIQEYSPESMPILTDHFELALFAERENYGGYYWTIREYEQWPASEALEDVAMVASRRPLEWAMPPAAVEVIQDWPCAKFNEVTLSWNPSAGDPPPGYAVGECPDITPADVEDLARPIER